MTSRAAPVEAAALSPKTIAAIRAGLVAFPFLCPLVAGPSVQAWQLFATWMCVAAMLLAIPPSLPARGVWVWLAAGMAAVVLCSSFPQGTPALWLPVFRGELNLFADGAPELFLAVHHIAADGQSVALLIGELQALLAAPAGSAHLAAPVLQYADYAVWQRQWLEAGELERQTAYWREQLRDAPQSTPLPLDRPRQNVRDARGGQLSF
ncbi:MAG TPA: condensation domain-containing protein, partial [Variovorax sp.]|nr:condensation domain-containing protein [Variovorax sp.]